jgi:hypothetical protein
MAGNYGTIIVAGDYEGDLKAIVDSLNSLRWNFGDSDGAHHEWTVEQGWFQRSSGERGIIVLKGDVPCPSLRPMGRFVVSKKGRRCLAADADELEDRCTLRELSALISPHLTKGTIEFVAVHASRGYISHERLLIDADGHAEWDSCNSSDRFSLSRWTRREAECEKAYKKPFVGRS